ncbi:hypothetical protein ACQ4PT_002560 [Festuca glaucescens]
MVDAAPGLAAAGGVAPRRHLGIHHTERWSRHREQGSYGVGREGEGRREDETSRCGIVRWTVLVVVGRAEALTSTGQPIAFSIFPAEPPGVSHFCVHCRGLEDAGYSTEPSVVHSTDNLAILTICLKHGRDLHREYFLYRASRPSQPPSLEPLPGLHDQLLKLRPLASIAVVSCGGGAGEHFILAALGPIWKGQYDFHVFRSNLGTWTEKVVALGENAAMDPKKVIVLGGGEVGWVDLLRGILVCNLLDDDPVFRVIPLPTLLPVNRVYSEHRRSAEQFRDVVCVDGVVKLVEIEYCRRRIVHDVSKLEVLYDDDLTLGANVYTEPKETYEYTGWRLLTWNRAVSSNCWRRGSLVHADDLIVDDMRHSALLPGLVEKNARKNIRPTCPTLSMDGTDVVYLKCKVEPKDKKSWVVAVDMRKETIEDVASFPDKRSRNRNYITCAAVPCSNVLMQSNL